MVAHKATFTDMLPIMEVRDGLVFLTVTDEGHSVCTPVHHFELFMEDARRHLAEWHARQAIILPFPKETGPRFISEDHTD